MEQTQDVQHSPRLPWRHGTFKPYIYEADGSGAATVTEQFDPERRVALAEFIVRAVNSHDDLVAALEAATDWVEHDSLPNYALLGQLRETIRKARGEE